MSSPVLTSTINSKVWEDKAGALTLAKLEPPQITPRSKHYGIKYHWFRETVYNDETRTLNKIETKEQIADILIKSLPRDRFQYLRNILMGW